MGPGRATHHAAADSSCRWRGAPPPAPAQPGTRARRTQAARAGDVQRAEPLLVLEPALLVLAPVAAAARVGAPHPHVAAFVVPARVAAGVGGLLGARSRGAWVGAGGQAPRSPAPQAPPSPPALQPRRPAAAVTVPAPLAPARTTHRKVRLAPFDNKLPSILGVRLGVANVRRRAEAAARGGQRLGLERRLGLRLADAGPAAVEACRGARGRAPAVGRRSGARGRRRASQLSSAAAACLPPPPAPNGAPSTSASGLRSPACAPMPEPSMKPLSAERKAAT
jgi:hypothetical protein